jgi:hypothetical protein
MPTQLFLRSISSSLGGAGQLALSTNRGGGSVTAITRTTAGGTNIPVTATADGQALTWFSEPMPEGFTLTGTCTVNIRGREAATSVNAGRGILIERTNEAGVVQANIVADTTVPATIAEYTTTDAANAAFAPTVTSNTFAVGDRIKVTLKVRNAGTMGANASGVTNSYDSRGAAAVGDTYITFSQDFRPAVPVDFPMNYAGRGGYG